MARAHRVVIYASAFLLIYLLAVFAIFPNPFLDTDILAHFLPIVPWWVLVAFGAYSLVSPGRGLFTFQDCLEAYQELLKEINDAKNNLRGKGVTVD